MSYGLLFAILGTFVAVALPAGGAASWWLTRNSPEQRRLRGLAKGGAQGPLAIGRLADGAADEVLARLSRFVPKSPKDMSRLQLRLTRAGFVSKGAPIYFSLAQLGLCALLAILALVAFGFGNLPYAAMGGMLGYLLPGFYVSRKTTEWQKAIRNGLPDCLDLLTVCVEAGSGLDQAVNKASEELEISHPILARQLKIVTTEIRAGKPRVEAFKNFSDRTGVEDVRGLVAMLVQTDRFGTSIGQALRVHSDTMRTKRRQRAEERAAKVSVKLVFPLVLCLFPALYLVCFGPVVIRIYRAFFESGGIGG